MSIEIDHTILPPVSMRGMDLTQLVQAKQTATMPHALLLSGLPGLGKQRVARYCAAILLCEQQDETVPCGHCQACRWQQAGTHPDYYHVYPEQNASTIKIDQVRVMLQSLQQTPQHAGFRVVVIEPADCLTTAAVNSVLKIIEEPGDNTVLLLVTAQPMSLPATLRSRCIHVVFQVPPLEKSSAWLQQTLQAANQDVSLTQCQQWLTVSDGAPLTALAIASDPQLTEQMTQWLEALQMVFQQQCSPVMVAQTWMTQAIDDLITQWIRACCGLVWQLHGHAQCLPASWSTLVVPDIDVSHFICKLFTFIDQLTNTRGMLNSAANPNQQLLLESLLVKWYRLAN